MFLTYKRHFLDHTCQKLSHELCQNVSFTYGWLKALRSLSAMQYNEIYVRFVKNLRQPFFNIQVISLWLDMRSLYRFLYSKAIQSEIICTCKRKSKNGAIHNECFVVLWIPSIRWTMEFLHFVLRKTYRVTWVQQTLQLLRGFWAQLGLGLGVHRVQLHVGHILEFKAKQISGKEIDDNILCSAYVEFSTIWRRAQ